MTLKIQKTLNEIRTKFLFKKISVYKHRYIKHSLNEMLIALKALDGIGIPTNKKEERLREKYIAVYNDADKDIRNLMNMKYEAYGK